MSRRFAFVALLIAAIVGAAVLVGDRAAETSPQRNAGFLGVEFAPLTRAAQGRAPFLTEGGALVVKVLPRSAAEQAHIKTGEIVTAIDGEPVSSAADAAEMLKSKE